MSCSVNEIPSNAQTIARTTGTVRPASAPDLAGHKMEVAILEARCGGTITRFVTVRIDGFRAGNYGRKTWCKRFSGKNLRYADEFYQVNAADIDVQSVVPGGIA